MNYQYLINLLLNLLCHHLKSDSLIALLLHLYITPLKSAIELTKPEYDEADHCQPTATKLLPLGLSGLLGLSDWRARQC